VSTLGEREYRGVCAFALSGGKLVCRRGCEDADVVESIDALRRFMAGPDKDMSDCRRLGGWGSCAFDGYGGEIAERDGWWYGGDAIVNVEAVVEIKGEETRRSAVRAKDPSLPMCLGGRIDGC
jgi:hypothetical protein